MIGTVEGGTIVFERWTEEYRGKYDAIFRHHAWRVLLEDGMRPTKWGKPTRKGCEVMFERLLAKDIKEEIQRFNTNAREVEQILGISKGKLQLKETNFLLKKECKND